MNNRVHRSEAEMGTVKGSKKLRLEAATKHAKPKYHVGMLSYEGVSSM